MSLMIILHGLPGSGKGVIVSRIQPGLNAYVSNRDSLRTELFGDEYHTKTPDHRSEKKVTEIEESRMHDAFKNDVNVIVDNTNLSPKVVNNLRRIANVHNATIAHIFVDVAVETAKTQNKKRGDEGGRRVPDHVIDAMAEKSYKNGLIDRSRLVLDGEAIF